MKTGNGPAHDIDGNRQPGAANGAALDGIHQNHIHPRMIDLDTIERTVGARRLSADRLGSGIRRPGLRHHLPVDMAQPAADGGLCGSRHPRLPTVCTNGSDNLRRTHPLARQILGFDHPGEDRLTIRRKAGLARRAPTLAGKQCGQFAALLPEAVDQDVCPPLGQAQLVRRVPNAIG